MTHSEPMAECWRSRGKLHRPPRTHQSIVHPLMCKSRKEYTPRHQPMIKPRSSIHAAGCDPPPRAASWLIPSIGSCPCDLVHRIAEVHGHAQHPSLPRSGTSRPAGYLAGRTTPIWRPRRLEDPQPETAIANLPTPHVLK